MPSGRSSRSRGLPFDRARREHTGPATAGAAIGLADGAPPDWLAVEAGADRGADRGDPAGRPGPQKAPRIQAALRLIREERGDHSLEFLGDMPALEARDWLTRIDGIGRKTASVLLMFSFGMPLMPVDRHVERVSKRVGLIPRQGERRRRPRALPGAARARPDVRGPRQPDHPRPEAVPRPQARLRPTARSPRAAASSIARPPEPSQAQARTFGAFRGAIRRCYARAMLSVDRC